jgi:hypothetical protein
MNQHLSLPRISTVVLGLISLGFPTGHAQGTGSIEYQWKNVKIVAGGFITGIIPDPGTPGLMYVRTDIGGAYRIDRLHKSWTPLTDIFNQNDWNLGGTESLAIDPVDPSRIYLAQGDYTETWAPNGAILGSHDFGETFSQTTPAYPAWIK